MRRRKRKKKKKYEERKNMKKEVMPLGSKPWEVPMKVTPRTGGWKRSATGPSSGSSAQCVFGAFAPSASLQHLMRERGGGEGEEIKEEEGDERGKKMETRGGRR